MKVVTKTALALLVLISGVLSSAYAGVYSESGFDMNDLSVLFPMGDQGPSPVISLEDPSFVLLPAPVFGEMLAFASSRKVILLNTDPGMWKVVSFRYDPCAPGINPSNLKGCLQEIRLVLHPVRSGAAADQGMHLIYQIGTGMPDAADPVIAALMGLKTNLINHFGISTNGIPLGTHPGLARDKTGQFADEVRAFLMKFISPAKLTIATMFIGSGPDANGGEAPGVNQSSWSFFGGKVINGHWVVDNASGLPHSLSPSDQMISMTLQPEAFGPFSVNFRPLRLSTVPLLESVAKPGSSPSSAELNAVNVIEEPRITTRDNMDCISCHTSTSMRDAWQIQATAGQIFTPAAGVTAFTNALQPHSVTEVQAFSPNGVANVTINSTADIVNYINTQILHLANPGKDCSSVMAEILNCLFIAGATDNIDSCWNKCK